MLLAVVPNSCHRLRYTEDEQKQATLCFRGSGFCGWQFLHVRATVLMFFSIISSVKYSPGESKFEPQLRKASSSFGGWRVASLMEF
ncbi:hypothetical protein SDJN03_27277, partial [Cucurbita argyrosperma subsp. sororia]